MVSDLARSIRAAYDQIDNSETGRPDRVVSDTVVQGLQRRGEALKVTALWTAARGLIFPQVGPGLVAPCAGAIQALRQALASGGVTTPPPSMTLRLDGGQIPEAPDVHQNKASHCLLQALACCLDFTPARFQRVVELLDAAQQLESHALSQTRMRWIGWLDDVVSRSDRFNLDTALTLLERTLRGTLGVFAGGLDWEATADDSHKFNIWVCNPRTRDLLTRVMSFAPVQLAGRKLVVTVLPDLDLVCDPWRIEYFFEQVVHRQFLDGLYFGRYDQIEYECVSTGERWQAPA